MLPGDDPHGSWTLGGAGRARPLAAEQARLERLGEQHCEVAAGELGAYVGAVGCLLEQMGVGVEGHARSGVPEHAADPQVVEADPPPSPVEARAEGRAAEHPLGDVVVEEGRPRPVANT